MMKRRICPNCGRPLTSYCCEDSDDDDFKILNFFSGECDFCQKSFSWTEVYVFEGIQNMKEEDDD